MNTFLAILTIFAAPTDVASNAPLTLQPLSTIEFNVGTEKQVNANCARVAKALVAAKMTAYCSVAVSSDVAAAE